MAIDLRGYGQSSKPEVGFDARAGERPLGPGRALPAALGLGDGVMG